MTDPNDQYDEFRCLSQEIVLSLFTEQKCPYEVGQAINTHLFDLLHGPMNIQTQLLLTTSQLPKRAKPDDAAFDLYAAESIWIRPGERVAVDIGIAIAIPSGYFGRICGRSGLAIKSGIAVLGGIIDAGYRGPIKAILLNTSQGGDEESVQIKVGDRCAQLIVERSYDVEFVQANFLPESSRGANGFGSSGV